MVQGDFASALSSLLFLFRDEELKDQDAELARSLRDETQDEAYPIMKAYRENVRGAMMSFPALVETMPRLSPLPGHTPEPVNATATFEAPDKFKVVHGASDDPTLYRYQLRGHVGTEFNESDAVVIATHGPGEPLEFITTFGLDQPGVHVVSKLFVILTTGNEAGSAPIVVQRPFSAVA